MTKAPPGLTTRSKPEGSEVIGCSVSQSAHIACQLKGSSQSEETPTQTTAWFGQHHSAELISFLPRLPNFEAADIRRQRDPVCQQRCKEALLEGSMTGNM